MIAAHIGNEIFIRSLNQVNRDQQSNSLAYHNSITFMPVYFDFDHNFMRNRELQKSESRKTKSLRRSSEEHSDASSRNKIYSVKSIEKYIKLYLESESKSRMGSIYVRNAKLRELLEYVRVISSNPAALLEAPIRLQKSTEKICMSFEIFRNFQSLDKLAIAPRGLNKIAELKSFGDFMFDRSNEYIKDFRICTNPKKMFFIVLIGRKLHAYDFITNRLLFKIDLSSAMSSGCSAKPINTMFLIESDQVIVVQDGESRLILISVFSQIDIYSRILVKQKQD